MITKKSKNEYSWSKSAFYKGKFVESGPMARMILQKRDPVYKSYQEYRGSMYIRVLSRLDEVCYLLCYLKSLISKLDIKQPSYIKPDIKIDKIDEAFGIGLTEASRGSLVHEVKIEKGLIKKYNIITPTVWNLGPGSKNNPSTFQKSIIGLKNKTEAEIVLRSFDICSVCTTH
jgi:hydrogenase large subunit